MSLRRDLEINAQTLNQYSDQFGQYMDQIDEILRRLNIGLEVWTPFEGASPQLEIGYTKKGKKWGVAIRQADQVWFVNDAPREYRLMVVDSIPALFIAMTKAARDTTNKILEGVATVKGILEGMGQ